MVRPDREGRPNPPRGREWAGEGTPGRRTLTRPH